VNVERLRVLCLNIPFVQGFQHAAADRRSSDAVIVELTADGVVGYGEAAPRPYVSGETVDSVVQHVGDVAWPRLRRRATALSASSPSSLLADIERELLPWNAPERFRDNGTSLAPTSARCAVELALVDCWLKARGMAASAILPPRRDEARYSGVIATGNAERAAQLARKMRQGGLSSIKVKVGDEFDEPRLRAVREVMGADVQLRIDANGAWDLETAIERLQTLARYDIDSCEEPLGRARRDALPALTRSSSIATMVDESLVTEADARWLIEHGACNAFNLRVSKLGGLLPCLRLAAIAAHHGLFCQLGSHVGETSVLAAAGRHLALHLDELRAVEGSFGSFLLSQDIASPSVKFGHGGRGSKLSGVGLGVSVVPERLESFATRIWSSG